MIVSEQLADKIADALVEDGYIILENVVDEYIINRLYERARSLKSSELRRARISKRLDKRVDNTERTDETSWLNRDNEIELDFLNYIESLRLALNRRLFLGLFEYEAHFAHYKKGGFYKKHYDNFLNDGERKVTTVLYLNKKWDEHSDGGELLIYDRDNVNEIIKTVTPTFGKMVIFMSSEFPHEVAIAKNRTRFSIAGWLRTNSSRTNVVNPLY